MAVDWASLGGSAVDVAGNIANTWLADKDSALAAMHAQQFSANMANTAHQREVADLKAAGLNPILSAGGKGDPSPSGVMPSIYKADQIDPVGKYLALSNAKAQIQATQSSAAASAAQAQNSTEQVVTQKTQQAANSAAAARDLSTKSLNYIQGFKVSADAANSAANAKATELQNIKRAADMKLYEGVGGKIMPWIDKLGDIAPHLIVPFVPAP